MNNKKLLPCPFCGSEAKCEDGFMPFESVFYTYCANPDCALHSIDDFKFTSEEWNTRHSDKSEIGSWISVEDRLPEINQSVLAVRKNNVTNMALDKQGLWFTDGYGIEIKSKFDDVTHWMPQLEPPK